MSGQEPIVHFRARWNFVLSGSQTVVPWTSRISITWELIRNVNSQAPSNVYWVRDSGDEDLSMGCWERFNNWLPRVYWLLWFIFSHSDRFQATTVMLLNVELGRDAHRQCSWADRWNPLQHSAVPEIWAFASIRDDSHAWNLRIMALTDPWSAQSSWESMAGCQSFGSKTSGRESHSAISWPQANPGIKFSTNARQLLLLLQLHFCRSRRTFTAPQSLWGSLRWSWCRVLQDFFVASVTLSVTPRGDYGK